MKVKNPQMFIPNKIIHKYQNNILKIIHQIHKFRIIKNILRFLRVGMIIKKEFREFQIEIN